MKKAIWVLAATAAVVLLMWGVHRATRPSFEPLTRAEAEQRIEALAVRLNAALENERDLTPIYEETQEVLADQPRIAAGHKLVGQIRISHGEHREAYDAFARALELDPQDPHLHSLAGSAAMIVGNQAAAESHHRMAIQQAPNRPGLMLPLADLLLKQERWEEARGVLLSMGELDMTMHQVNAGLSDMYRGRGQEGDMALAVSQMENAVSKVRRGDEKLLPTRVAYVRKLARLYAELDEPMEAARALTQLLPPQALDEPEMAAELAGYLEANGQPVLAAMHYDAIFGRDPTDRAAAEQAVDWYLKAEAVSSAQAVIDRLEEVAPQHPALPALRERISSRK